MQAALTLGVGPLAQEVVSPMPSHPTPIVRFFAKVAQFGDCWIWLGSTSAGYGRVWTEGKAVYAPRWLYETLVGPIPDGLQPDHLCRVRLCVFSGHLEPVTNRENILRGSGWCAINARKTHCLYGHPLNGDNLYCAPNGQRRCRECSRQKNRAWQASHQKERKMQRLASYHRRKVLRSRR